MLTYDSETALIERGNPAPRLVCGAFAHDDEPPVVLTADMTLKALRFALVEEERPILGHNVPYDMGVAVQEDPTLAVPVIRAALDNRIYDTLTLCAIIDIASGYSDARPSYKLMVLASRFLGIDLSAVKLDPFAWRYRFVELLQLPRDKWPKSAVDYAKGDAEHTRAIWNILWEEASPALRGEAIHQTGTAVCLRMLTLRGLKVDAAPLAAIRQRCEKAAGASVLAMQREGMIRANGTRDMKALRARVESAYAERGEQPPRTDTGLVSTAQETLIACGDHTLTHYALAGGERKLLEGFIPRLSTRRGIVTPGYRIPAVTGRAKGDLQNMPRAGGLRECIIARDGHTLVWGDYSQIELCAMGQICLELFGHSPLADAINAGHDVHVMTGAVLLGIREDELDRSNEEHEKARRDAKNVNFARLGGQGPRGLIEMSAGQGRSLSMAHAKRLIAAHKKAWPDVQRYLDWAYAEHRAGRPAIVRPSGRARITNHYTAACNTRFQGRVADGMHLAVRRLVSESYDPAQLSPLWGVCWPAMDMHDEVVVESLTESVDVVSTEIAAIMHAEMVRVIPDVAVRVDMHSGQRWGK